MPLILHENHTVSIDYGITQGHWRHLTYREAKTAKAHYRFQCWCGDVTYTQLKRDLKAETKAHLEQHLGPIK